MFIILFLFMLIVLLSQLGLHLKDGRETISVPVDTVVKLATSIWVSVFH